MTIGGTRFERKNATTKYINKKSTLKTTTDLQNKT